MQLWLTQQILWFIFSVFIRITLMLSNPWTKYSITNAQSAKWWLWSIQSTAASATDAATNSTITASGWIIASVKIITQLLYWAQYSWLFILQTQMLYFILMQNQLFICGYQLSSITFVWFQHQFSYHITYISISGE